MRIEEWGVIVPEGPGMVAGGITTGLWLAIKKAPLRGAGTRKWASPVVLPPATGWIPSGEWGRRGGSYCTGSEDAAVPGREETAWLFWVFCRQQGLGSRKSPDLRWSRGGQAQGAARWVDQDVDATGSGG